VRAPKDDETLELGALLARRRQLIDIGETVVNNAFGAAPEYGKSGARQRSCYG